MGLGSPLLVATEFLLLLVSWNGLNAFQNMVHLFLKLRQKIRQTATFTSKISNVFNVVHMSSQVDENVLFIGLSLFAVFARLAVKKSAEFYHLLLTVCRFFF